ncbi:MAG: hypothetical protein AAFO62_12130, partial [Pseudomonadota bacterium]
MGALSGRPLGLAVAISLLALQPAMAQEAVVINNGDVVNDPVILDGDGDTLLDGDEVGTFGTNPALADSDADGLDDAAEINRVPPTSGLVG